MIKLVKRRLITTTHIVKCDRHTKRKINASCHMSKGEIGVDGSLCRLLDSTDDGIKGLITIVSITDTTKIKFAEHNRLLFCHNT